MKHHAVLLVIVIYYVTDGFDIIIFKHKISMFIHTRLAPQTR